MRLLRVGLIGLLLAAGAGLAACVPVQEVDFTTFTYASDACHPVIPVPPADGYEVHDGFVRHGTPVDADFYSVSVRPEVAYGDLTGDGVDEAAIILDCSTGNRPIPVGRVMTVGLDAPVALAAVPTPPLPGDASRIELASMAIADGELLTTWIVLDADDPPCCPSHREHVTYRWDGSSLLILSRDRASAGAPS